MHPLTNLKPSATLKKLRKESQLTNVVSKQALVEAIQLWQLYKITPNKQRSRDQLEAVADKLEFIITQVTNGCTRINPTMWMPLNRLEHNLRDAAFCNIHLELNTKAANDDHVDSEVA